MAFRVVLAGIYHESNTFVEKKTTVADFENGHLLYGEQIREEYRDAHHEIGGMIEVIENEGLEIIPLFFAEATPGGMLTSDTFDFLANELLLSFQGVGHFDACLVVAHGAAVSEGIDDMDGEWLARLRQRLGPTALIVGTLDLHANVSAKMVANTDALVAYSKNPHIDQRERGQEAAMIVVNTLRRRYKPTQKLEQVPLAVSIEQQFTAHEPCRSLYEFAKAFEETANVISVSVTLGFPYADVWDMGTSVIVVTDDDVSLAETIAQKIAAYVLQTKERFIGLKHSVERSLQMARNASKPVLLLDMGDNIGGGAPGNGLDLLEALQTQGALRFFMCLYDPSAVEVVDRLDGMPGEVEISGFNRSGYLKKTIAVKPIAVRDGKFQERTPRHGGQVSFNMGKMALVEFGAGNTLMFMSLRIPPFSLNQLTSFGVEPQRFDAIIAKGVNAPIAAYGQVCRTIIQVDTPGVTQADMTRFNYKNRRTPLFPFETENI